MYIYTYIYTYYNVHILSSIPRFLGHPFDDPFSEAGEDTSVNSEEFFEGPAPQLLEDLRGKKTTITGFLVG